MKMYILIREDVPDNFAPLISAHASLACYKKFENDEFMQAWVNAVFKKVICKVSTAEFERFKNFEKHIILTESALDNQEVCISFCPREDFPKAFQFLRMWKISEVS